MTSRASLEQPAPLRVVVGELHVLGKTRMHFFIRMHRERRAKLHQAGSHRQIGLRSVHGQPVWDAVSFPVEEFSELLTLRGWHPAQERG